MFGSRRADMAEALVVQLFNNHGRAMLAYANRLTGDQRLAENACQETLSWAARHPAAFLADQQTTRCKLFVEIAAVARRSRPPASRIEPGPARQVTPCATA